jgi:7-cyano-7-deazaguanine synthase
MKTDSVILLSGGLDSAVTALLAMEKGYRPAALTFLYGQRHLIEREAAARVASAMGLTPHIFIDIPSGIFNSALITGSPQQVPKNALSSGTDIPATYVPARNILFLSYALAYAESAGAETIFIGANAVDYSGYPDCRPGFFEAFNHLSAVGTKAGVEGRPVKVETPIITMSKSEIISNGARLGLDFSITHSCYDPVGGLACGECDSCILRRNGFIDAGVPDTTRYR